MAFILTVLLSISSVDGQEMVRHRSDGSGLLLMDPRGNKPANINDPIPYTLYHRPDPCVNDQAEEADYYYFNENEGWEYQYTVQREMSPWNTVVRELTYDRDEHKVIALKTFRYDDHQRLTYIATSAPDSDGILRESARHFLDYEQVSGILLNDSLLVLRNGQWEKEKVIHTSLSMDQDLHVSSCVREFFASPYQYDPVIYRFHYENGKLSSIEQSKLEPNTGMESPSYRYDGFDYKDASLNRLSYYRSAFSDGWTWTAYRTDRFEQIHPKEEVFTGTILLANEQYSAHKNRMIKDDNGNVTRLIQTAFDSKRNEWDTLSDVRFLIEYMEDGKTPLVVSSIYRTIDGQQTPSMKVTYRSKSTGDVSVNQFVVYPNPASGRVLVHWDEPVNTASAIEVFDGAGKIVLESKINSDNLHRSEFDVSSLKPGNYTVKLSSSSRTAPLIVVH